MSCWFSSEEQVVEKIVPVDLILRDLSVSELYIDDALQRQATHALFRTVVTQLEAVIDRPVSRSCLPDSIHIGRLEAGQVLVQLSDGSLVIMDRNSKQTTRVFPRDFSISSVLIINHVVDRGSTTLSMLSFAAHCGLLWTPTWGWFHDLWNGIKAACKIKAGRWWLHILRFVSIANINHGPFRSGVWGRSKQTALTSYLQTRSSSSADFRAVAERNAALAGRLCTSDADFDEWFRWMARLPSCVSAGPICKFARWMSIQECWEFYRAEMWMLREVLIELGPGGLHSAPRSADGCKDEHLLQGAPRKGTIIYHTGAHRCHGHVQHRDRPLQAIVQPQSSTHQERLRRLRSHLVACGWRLGGRAHRRCVGGLAQSVHCLSDWRFQPR